MSDVIDVVKRRQTQVTLREKHATIDAKQIQSDLLTRQNDLANMLSGGQIEEIGQELVDSGGKGPRYEKALGKLGALQEKMGNSEAVQKAIGSLLEQAGRITEEREELAEQLGEVKRQVTQTLENLEVLRVHNIKKIELTEDPRKQSRLDVLLGEIDTSIEPHLQAIRDADEKRVEEGLGPDFESNAGKWGSGQPKPAPKGAGY